MSHAAENPYASFGMTTAADAPASERVAFLKRTYLHVAGAIYALVAIEFALFNIVPAETMNKVVQTMVGGYGWLVVLGAFMAVSFVAQRMAESGASAGKQYMGLSLYVVAQSIILLPLLWYAYMIDPSAIFTAAVLTLLIFAGLTGAVMVTGKDFSFLGPILGIASMAALGLIVVSIFFGGITLGVLFAGAMCVLMGGYILYYTSYVLHHCRTDQHVAASLLLFSAVATLFWYILQLVMSRD